MGAPALTSRGMTETDFDQVAAFVDEAVQIAISIKEELGKHKMKDFKTAVQTKVCHT